MLTGSLALPINILINVLIVILVPTSVNADSGFQSDIKFVNLTTKRPTPTNLLITWINPKCDPEANISIQYRQQGEIAWENIGIHSGNAPNLYHLNVPSACSTYEIRLGILCEEKGEENSYFSETVIADLPQIPDRLEPIKPVITGNLYNNRTDTIHIEFTLENRTDSIWPLDSRYLTAEVHVVECGGGSENGDHDFIAPVPSIRWIADQTAIVQFPKQYVAAAESGQACQIMISITELAKICGHPIKIDSQILDYSVFVDLSCDNTENLPCSSFKTSKLKKLMSPRCDPEFVDASQMITTAKNVKLRVMWDFDKNTTGSILVKPEKIILRYGYTDIPSNADPLLAVLVPMREIGRFRVVGNVKDTTIYTNTSSEPNFDPTIGHRFHRISICAIFGNDTEEEERKINWAIIPTFAVKVIQPNASKEGGKECKCKESEISSLPPIKNLEETGIGEDSAFSTSTIPAIVSSPTNQGFETFWAKVAPLLTVFLTLTLINIILLMATCYYYKKAKSFNAVK